MGNPILYWDYGRQSIDLGSNGLSAFDGGVVRDGSVIATPAIQTVVTRLFDELDIQQAPITDIAEVRALHAFQSWYQKGLPFAFALDSADAVETFLTLDMLAKNLLTNGNCESWDQSSPVLLTGATVTEVGTTTIRRENAAEHVAEGRYSVKFSIDSTPHQSTLQLPDSDTAITSTATILTYQAQGGTTLANLEVAIQNRNTLKYLQSGGTWGVSIAWLSSAGSGVLGGLTMGTRFGTATHAFTNDAGTGAFRITFRNAATASGTIWLDDIRLYTNVPQLNLRETSPLTASNYYKLISKTGFHREIVQVATISTATAVQLAAVPKMQYLAGDRLVSPDYYPYLVGSSKDPILEEIPGGLTTGAWRLRIRAIESLTGRA